MRRERHDARAKLRAVEDLTARVRSGSTDGALDRATELQIATELEAILKGDL